MRYVVAIVCALFGAVTGLFVRGNIALQRLWRHDEHNYETMGTQDLVQLVLDFQQQIAAMNDATGFSGFSYQNRKVGCKCASTASADTWTSEKTISSLMCSNMLPAFLSVHQMMRRDAIGEHEVHGEIEVRQRATLESMSVADLKALVRSMRNDVETMFEVGGWRGLYSNAQVACVCRYQDWKTCSDSESVTDLICAKERLTALQDELFHMSNSQATYSRKDVDFPQDLKKKLCLRVGETAIQSCIGFMQAGSIDQFDIDGQAMRRLIAAIGPYIQENPHATAQNIGMHIATTLINGGGLLQTWHGEEM